MDTGKGNLERGNSIQELEERAKGMAGHGGVFTIWGFIGMAWINGFVFKGSEPCWQAVICRQIRRHYRRVLTRDSGCEGV